MSQVSLRAFRAVRQRLASQWALMLDEEVTANRADYAMVSDREIESIRSIDWTGAKAQVFDGRLDINAIEESASPAYPVVFVYVASANDDAEEKFRTFSGTVDVGVDFVWTWASQSPPRNAEEIAGLLEAVSVKTLRNRNWIGFIAPGVSHPGGWSVSKTPVETGSRNWRMILTVLMRMGVDV